MEKDKNPKRSFSNQFVQDTQPFKSQLLFCYVCMTVRRKYPAGHKKDGFPPCYYQNKTGAVLFFSAMISVMHAVFVFYILFPDIGEEYAAPCVFIKHLVILQIIVPVDPLLLSALCLVIMQEICSFLSWKLLLMR